MSESQLQPALYRIVGKRPDGACVWATLAPVRTGGDAVQAWFCNADDVAYLADEAPKHRMATLLAKNGKAARLLPVTVGLDVSIVAGAPGGDTTVVALPRPAPLKLAAAHAELRPIIEDAATHHRPVVFALSDSRTVIDAAAIDRATALEMLGMREQR